MAVIKDAGEYWKVEIYPEAQFVENIDESAKGYRAVLGYDPQTYRHVVMTVLYDKNMYPIGDVLKKIDGMKACSRCDALDKAKLEHISIETAPAPIQDRQRDRIYNPPVPVAQVPEQPIAVRRNVKELFTNALFDAYLTPAGKMMIGNVFGDQDLVAASMPQTDQELAELWDDTTQGRLVRSPENAKEFMNVLRTGPVPESTKVANKKNKFIQNIVIG